MVKNRLLGAACVLLMLVLISTWLVCGLYARYTAEGSGGGSARAAAFVFLTQDKENSRYLDLSGIKKPGDSVTYTFTVTNQSGSTVSEVAESVQFTVQLNGSMPLTCTISGGEAAQPILTVDAQGSLVKRTENAGILPASQEKTNTYTMTVEWPEEAKNIEYASRSAVAEVLLTVAAEQID